MNGQSRTGFPARSGSKGRFRKRGLMPVICRRNTSGRSPGATVWDWDYATGCSASSQDDCRNVALLYEPVERRDVGVEHGLEPVELRLQRRRQLVEDLL